MRFIPEQDGLGSLNFELPNLFDFSFIPGDGSSDQQVEAFSKNMVAKNLTNEDSFLNSSDFKASMFANAYTKTKSNNTANPNEYNRVYEAKKAELEGKGVKSATQQTNDIYKRAGISTTVSAPKSKLTKVSTPTQTGVPIVKTGNQVDDTSNGQKSNLESKEWILGLPNWATIGIGVGAGALVIGGVYLVLK